MFKRGKTQEVELGWYRRLETQPVSGKGDAPKKESYSCRILCGSPVSKEFCRQESKKFNKRKFFCDGCDSPFKANTATGAANEAMPNKGVKKEIPFGQIAANANRPPRGIQIF